MGIKKTVTTAVAAYPEERLIIVAQGLQFTNAVFRLSGDAANLLVPDEVKRRLPALTMPDANSAEYLSKEQGVRFTIKVITDKAEFKKYLQQPEVHVVYSGHSRLGRGPCFSMDVFCQPGEDWENGSDPNSNGLFRMGYPYVPVMMHDILEHRYTAYPVPASQSIPKGDCHPMLQASYSKLKAYTLSEFEQGLKISDPTKRPRWKVDDPDQLFGKFWGVDMNSVAGTFDRHAVLYAGWTGTASAPMDLGATNIQCRVLCLFACSTFMHYQKIVRERKNWRQAGNDGYAYFTTEAAYSDIAPRWVYHLLTYKKYNAFQSWKDSLEYAQNRTNIELVAAGRNYRVI